MSEIIITTNEHEDMNYEYELCQDENGKFYVWVSTGPLTGYRAVTEIVELSDAVKEMYQTIIDEEGWE